MFFQRTWVTLNYMCFMLFVVLIVFYPTTSPAAILHVILAGDTTDSEIGASVQQDLNNITALIETISNKTGMDYRGYSLDGKTLTNSNLNDVINPLTVTPDDVIFFYYSGHGGRYRSTPSKWPLLKFQDTLVDFQQVIHALSAKQPRLLIALADCCNNYVEESLRQKFGQFKKVEPSAESYQKLFLRQQGSYIASGSIPGEPSIAVRDGGLFTLHFLQKLDSELASDHPNWRNIQTTVLTAPDGEQQHPQYDIQIASISAVSPPPVIQPTPAQPASPTQPPAPSQPTVPARHPVPTPPPAPTPPPMPPQPSAKTHEGTNLLRNGDFRQNTAYWNFRGTNWLVKNLNGMLVLATNDAQQQFDEPSVYQDVKKLKKRRGYTFDAVLCSPTLPRTIRMVIWELGQRTPILQAQQYTLTQACQRLSVSYQKQNNNTVLRVEIYYARGDPPEDIYIRDAWLQ